MLRIALYHDFLVNMGGAERVAENLHRTFPDSDLYTSMTAPERLSQYFKAVRPKTSWMQILPAKSKFFRHYFLLYPFAVEMTNLKDYDLVVSSCFGYAKGVRRGKSAIHVCYCHNPMRWVWRTTDYLASERFGRIKNALIKFALKPLRAWEMRAARRPDYYIANSTVVADRLHEAFGIKATVIPPPIETKRFHPCPYVDDYFLVLSRLAPYKRLDLAVQACSQLGLPLMVIGDGPDRKRLEKLAGPTITFLGRLPDAVVDRYARQCRALIFPGEEDFGITPLEINAAGRPVVAYRGGGALETIRDGVSGVFFSEQTVESLTDALQRFDSMTWDPIAIRRHAERFDTSVFQERIIDFLLEVVPDIADEAFRAEDQKAGAAA
jgi:glycosyltransferase involved in cell wall biosynthesis